MSKHTCKRKERFSNLEAAHIAARHIRRKHGLSRKDKSYSVYLCDVCYFLHVGTTLTDEQRADRRTLAERWTQIQELRQKALLYNQRGSISEGNDVQVEAVASEACI